MEFVAIDPATGRVIERYPGMDPASLSATVEAVHAAHLAWAEVLPASRADGLRRMGAILRDRATEWGTLMTSEMGKPLSQAVAEAQKCATVCDYYAEHGETFLTPSTAEVGASKSYWTYRPLGVVLGIMPWNYPFWQAIRFAAPALMAGNGILLKHAPNVPGCARALEALVHEAGLPRDLFRALLITEDDTQALIGHPAVRAISLTGSVRAGRAVATTAGAHIKKVVLELGGSDPYVVLEDADLDLAVEACAAGRLQNSGQSCIAAKRLIVVEACYPEFLDKLVVRMEQVTMGDPMAEETLLGPLAREDLRDALHDQVERSLASGARCLLGGAVPERNGWWYPPTVLVDVGPGSPAYDEELFGPVASVIRARDEDDAIRIANDTSFGLGAAVFTRDLERGERVAVERLDAGLCFVNEFARSHPALPFGGIKESGIGRELSPLGILEFVNCKTIWVA